MTNKKTIVVTGSSGYIGGEIALKLHDLGHKVIGIDRVVAPDRLKPAFPNFVNLNFGDRQTLEYIASWKPDAIIHCAGSSLVGSSVRDPSEYYSNNVAQSIKLIDMIKEQLPNTRIIFSSSASVYGVPYLNPCHEVDPCDPISPYGESKRMFEQMLGSYHKAYGLDYVSFRFFNACGADSQGRHGQNPGATHIISRVLESIYHDQEFTLNGDQFPTDDGTCIRDYVHVEDIANAHISALNLDIPPGVYNLGSGVGTSNKQIITAAERITGKKLKLIIGPTRDGDPAMLTADSAKFERLVGPWRTFDLDDMITHAWNWQHTRENV